MAARKRISKACDNCRGSKSKCEMLSEDSCKRCCEFRLKCATAIPARRRGPPKGYLHLVESKMHEFEALLGVLLSISESTPDAKLQDILLSIRKGDLGNSILEKVAMSAFGPNAMKAFTDRHPNSIHDYGNVIPTSKTPTNSWQCDVLRYFLSEHQKKVEPMLGLVSSDLDMELYQNCDILSTFSPSNSFKSELTPFLSLESTSAGAVSDFSDLWGDSVHTT